jgi:hypothetical protein
VAVLGGKCGHRYRGIWFRLGKYDGQYGDKYSGGLGTDTMKHVPMAVYAPSVDRTFFTYGGTRRGERDLLVNSVESSGPLSLLPKRNYSPP